MVHLSDDDLAKPIPCAGWTVRDLTVHTNTEHAAICGAPLNEATGPRTAFTVIAGEWLTKDGGLQLPHLWAGIDAEVFRQTLAGAPKDVEGITLTLGPVQGQSEQAPDALPLRVAGS